jgi:hypothetical protein
MKSARLSKLGLAASLLVFCSGTMNGAQASIFGQPAPPADGEVENTPEIQAASQRVEQTKVKLDQARKQLDAAKASLKAADAEFRAARADKEALSLRRQAEKLADASRPAGDASQAPPANISAVGRLTPPDRIDASNIVKPGSVTPNPPGSPDQQGDYGSTDQGISP